MDNSLSQTQTPTAGISPHNATDLPTLKSIHKIFLVLKPNSQYDARHSEYQKLLDLLTSLNTYSSLEKYIYDPTARIFFLERLIPTIAKKILRTKEKYSDEIEGILYHCLQQILLLCLNSFSESENSLIETALAILNPYKPYYTHPILLKSQAVNDNSYKLTSFNNLISFIKSSGVKLFERVYNIVNDTENIPSVKMMAFICLISCKFEYFYSQDSAKDYMNKIKEAVHDRLFNNASSYIDSFGFTDFKILVNGFATLLKALLASDEETHKALDIIKLRISKICLSSNTEASDDLGFTIIQDIVANLENESTSKFKFLSQPACHEFLRTIFDENPKALFRNMRAKKSPKLFQMMLKYDLLRLQEYQSVWVALKKENKSKPGRKNRLIRKLFPRGQEYSLSTLILKSLKNVPEDVELGDIRLISRIYDKYSKSIVFLDFLESFYWGIMVKNDRIKDQHVIQWVMASYIKLIDSADRSNTIKKIDECIENIESNIGNFLFFRIIQEFLAQLQWVDHLIIDLEYMKQKKVLQLLIEHFRVFKEQHSPTLNIVNESSYLKQISEKLNCLKSLLEKQALKKPDLTYEMLEEMWTIFVEHALFPAERDLFFAILSKMMRSHDGLVINHGDLKRFFEQKILNKEIQQHYLRMSKEGVACYHDFLIAVNHNLKKVWKARIRGCDDTQPGYYDVKVVPEELEGFEDVWSFVMSCEDSEASYRATEILFQTYYNLEDQFESELNNIRGRLITRCFEYMRPSSPTFSSSCCLKGLEIIKKVMDGSGSNGILELDGNSKLQKSEIFELSLKVSDFQMLGNDSNNNKKQVINCSSNSTVIELMKRIAKIINVNWERIQFYLYPYSPKPKKIVPAVNGFTLFDAGIRKYEVLEVLKAEFPKRAELLRDYDVLSFRAKALFTRFFEEFSDNGKMSIEQCSAYIHSCTNDVPRPTDARTKRMFENYDLDKDNYLTLDDFLKLYLDASKQRHHVVWNNLDAYGIRRDLRDIADIKRQENDKKSLVSYIISSNSEYYTVLLSLLDREEKEGGKELSLVSETWKLLNRLPTSPQIFEDVVMLKGVRGNEEEGHNKRDWNAILHLKSRYKALYVLNIVEYLVHYNDENTEKIALLEDPELIEYQKTWPKDFIKYGGLENLAGVFGLFKPDETTVLQRAYKRVYAFAKAMRSKLEIILMNMGEEEERSKALSFMIVLSEYESCFVKSEQTIAANKMRRAILKRKQKGFKCSV